MFSNSNLRRTILFGALSLMAASCGTQTTSSVSANEITTTQTQVFDMSSTKSSLNAFNDRFNETAARQDLDGILAMYVPDLVWIAPGERPTTGYKGPNETFGFLTQNNGFLSHTVDYLHISDDQTQAVMIGEAVIKVESAGMDATGTYLFVLKREGKTDWKIVTDMFHQHTK